MPGQKPFRAERENDTAGLPVPTPRPEQGNPTDVTAKIGKVDELPVEEAACRDRLTAMGVSFKPAKRIDGTGGCGVAYPISIERLPQGIALSGRTVLGCEVSEALANWTVSVAVPEAEKQFGAKLTAIDQYASYVCRTRNSQAGAKLSEHAKGNAIDLGRFRMADGTVVDVASDPESGTPEQAFLQTLREEGCTYFTTVLGPGSDGFHNSHFHFDVAKRRSGYRYCK
ncbi:MAG: extensin family protein [Pseudomonadota bacterium]